MGVPLSESIDSDCGASVFVSSPGNQHYRLQGSTELFIVQHPAANLFVYKLLRKQ